MDSRGVGDASLVEKILYEPQKPLTASTCKWDIGRMNFDGINITKGWCDIDPRLFNGTLLTMTIHDNETGELHPIGSAVLVNPCVCLFATHVLTEFPITSNPEKYSVSLTAYNEKGAVLWWGTEFHIDEGLDIGQMKISPAFKQRDISSILIPQISFDMPKLGDEIFLVGTVSRSPIYRKYDKIIVESLLCRGKVIETYEEGRDSSMLPYPCFAVDTPAFGGMSGGPVYDSYGRIIGLVSSSGENLPSCVSMLPRKSWRNKPFKMSKNTGGAIL